MDPSEVRPTGWKVRLDPTFFECCAFSPHALRRLPEDSVEWAGTIVDSCAFACKGTASKAAGPKGLVTWHTHPNSSTDYGLRDWHTFLTNDCQLTLLFSKAGWKALLKTSDTIHAVKQIPTGPISFSSLQKIWNQLDLTCDRDEVFAKKFSIEVMSEEQSISRRKEMNPEVVFLGSVVDLQIDILIHKLKEHGIESVRIDANQFIHDGDLSTIYYDPNDTRSFTCKMGDAILRLREAQVIYCREFFLEKDNQQESTAEQLINAEMFSILEGVLLNEDVFQVINHPHRMNIIDNKIKQLDMARRLGFKVPATLVTSEKKDIETFLRASENGVIIKQASDCAPSLEALQSEEYSRFAAFTRKLEADELSNFPDVSVSPGLFQDFISKAFEVRVVVFGNEIFAYKIPMGQTPESEVDFRKNPTPQTNEMALPQPIKDKLLSFMDSALISTACFDLVVDTDANWIFLEGNVSGNWLWHDHGFKISDTIANHLKKIIRK